ncbi:hypothetical protein DPMN_042711 [Dreissena polymorpha]|uniref:Uncharacterized protein n=1 Tax=Dreissena polymorpha TaxID=45954 RepID=A0A9D4HX54_DREPO|nr:hypothetical protein DPMN_042711 [Dreissena polymorpha]
MATISQHMEGMMLKVVITPRQEHIRTTMSSAVQSANPSSGKTSQVVSHTGMSSKQSVHPQRTHISEAFQIASDKQNMDPSQTKHMPKYSMEMVSQYNDIVSPEESLTYRRLPPVKLSYQSRNKFMETLKGDTTSKIIRPHLTLKTTAPGHHIFTEGISKRSIVPDPTFALQKIEVPYSNLPDNISIYKEKDKFTFGIKQDDDLETSRKSPYRLTPRPFAFGNAQLVTAMHKKTHSATESIQTSTQKLHGKRMKTSQSAISVKINKIKLEPLRGKDFLKQDPRNPTNSPVNDKDEIMVTIPTPHTYATHDEDNRKLKQNDQMKEIDDLYTTKRKLSVISIGDNMSPDFYEKPRKETRQQYPMFDHAARKLEQLKKETFGREISNVRPNVPRSTFTYKVSATSTVFTRDKTSDIFKPIRNNLRDKYGNLIHKQRGVKHPGTESLSRSSSDFTFRRYYSQGYHLPHSAGSGSTLRTHVPGNPPPSEISHSQSEDGFTIQPIIIEARYGMLTLIEERTMTESMLSNHIEKTKTPKGIWIDLSHENKETGLVEDQVSVPPTHRSKALTDIRSIDTDTELQFQNVYAHKSSSALSDSSRVIETETANEQESVNMHITEAVGGMIDIQSNELTEGTVADNTDNIVRKETTQIHTIDVPKNTPINGNKTESKPEKSITVALDNVSSADTSVVTSKQRLAVTKLSMENSFLPQLQPMSKERTSLSRNLQNISTSNDLLKFKSASTHLSLDRIHADQHRNLNESRHDKTVLVPIALTSLRLFPETSSPSSNAPPSSPVDEDRYVENERFVEYRLANSKRSEDVKEELIITKKAVSNANVPFIYPAKAEIKAKRH